jgi:hypothetical protein
MKRVIMIGVILFAGIALQAQTGGGPKTPECFKCVRMMYNAIDMTTTLMPFYPMAPVLPEFTKTSSVKPAPRKIVRPRVHPGNEFNNLGEFNQWVPSKS